MPSDLRERIVGLVDTAAPPIDVEALARQLAARDARDAERRVPSTPPLRRRVLAFAASFAGVLMLVGGALLAGVWLHEPATPAPDGFTDVTTATDAATSGWWWLTFVFAFTSLGAAAFIASRRRTQRPGEEDAMQTMEKRTETTRHPEVEKLTRQRRWLVIALAFVLVLGAVAIGWLIAENRSLSSDGSEAFFWPEGSDASLMGERVTEVLGPDGLFITAYRAGDVDAMLELFAPTAKVQGAPGNPPSASGGQVFPVSDGSAADMWRQVFAVEWNVDAEIVTMIADGNHAAVIMDSPKAGPSIHVFSFDHLSGLILRSVWF